MMLFSKSIQIQQQTLFRMALASAHHCVQSELLLSARLVNFRSRMVYLLGIKLGCNLFWP